MSVYARMLVLSLVMIAVGYAGGRIQAWNDVREARAQLQVAVDEHQRSVDTTASRHRAELSREQTKLAELTKANGRLLLITDVDEGASWLNRAVRELDERNFGTANDALRKAQAALSARVPEVEGLAEITARVEALDLTVANDIGPQRARLLALVDQLDPILTRERAAGGTQSAAESASP